MYPKMKQDLHVITRNFSFRNLTILRKAISAKSWYLFSWWEFEILLLWTFEIFVMTSRDFVTNGWNFHDGRSRFYCKRSRFLWWQVETLLWTGGIFMMTGRAFTINGRDFLDGRSRFSWWQVWILLWTVKIFMMTGQDFTMNGRAPRVEGNISAFSFYRHLSDY